MERHRDDSSAGSSGSDAYLDIDQDLETVGHLRAEAMSSVPSGQRADGEPASEAAGQSPQGSTADNTTLTVTPDDCPLETDSTTQGTVTSCDVVPARTDALPSAQDAVRVALENIQSTLERLAELEKKKNVRPPEYLLSALRCAWDKDECLSLRFEPLAAKHLCVLDNANS